MAAVFHVPNTSKPGWEQTLDNLVGRFVLVEPDSKVLAYLQPKGGYDLFDPQHSKGGWPGTSAIAAAADYVRHHGTIEDATFILGNKTDMDMLGAIAIIMGIVGVNSTAVMDRIAIIDGIDNGIFVQSRTYDPGEADANTELLSIADPSLIPDSKLLGRMAAERGLKMDDKVSMMAAWLASGIPPERFRTIIMEERRLFEQSLIYHIRGMKVTISLGTGASTLIYRNLVLLGKEYKGCPFGIALNPNAYAGPTDKVGGLLKYSIMQFAPGYVDLEAVFRDISAVEPGAGPIKPNVTAGGTVLNTHLSPLEVVNFILPHVTAEGRKWLPAEVVAELEAADKAKAEEEARGAEIAAQI